MSALRTLAEALQGSQGGGVSADCCASVVAALTSLQTATTIAIEKLAAAPAPVIQVDLSSLLAGFAGIEAAIDAAVVNDKACCNQQHQDLVTIANALAPGIDLTPIVDAIKAQTAFMDVPQAMIKQLFADGALPSEYQPLLQGAPWFTGDWLAKLNDYIGSLFGLGDHISSGIVEMTPRDKRIVAWATGVVSALFKACADYLGLPTTSFSDFLSAAMTKFIHAEDTVFEPIVGGLVDGIAKTLTPPAGTTVSLGNVGVNPDGPISAATGIALTAGALSWLLSFAGLDAGEPLAHIAELVAGAIGFEEIRDVAIGPLIRNGIGAVAEIHAKATFQQTVPGAGEVANWAARQLVPTASANLLATYSGVNAGLFATMTTAAQQGIRAFQLLRLMQTGLFSNADINDELTFGGVRPASSARYQLAAPYIASETERRSLHSTLVRAYVMGLLSDVELTDQLTSIESNTDRNALTLQAAKWEKLFVITRELEAQYTTLFEAGLIDDATYHSYLSAIGLQSDVANGLAAKAEARANATLQRRTIRQAEALERATEVEARRAAMTAFAAGQIDVAGLIAALGATGLTPLQAAAWTDIAELRQLGSQRWVFGKQLNTQAAELLRQRVAALKVQREKELLTDPQFTAQLNALGIPSVYVNAIRADANALIALSTSAAPVLVPLQTG
jgi:hypothetical protein